MHARLIEPHCGKNWSLQFFEIPKIEVPVSKDFPDMLTNIKNIVIRESIDIGKEF